MRALIAQHSVASLMIAPNHLQVSCQSLCTNLQDFASAHTPASHQPMCVTWVL